MTDSREALTPRDIPIIFSGAMIRALLDGRKQQTRRLAWRKPSEEFREYVSQVGAGIPGTICGKPSPWQKVKPGDRLWVREAWRGHRDHDDIPPRELFDGSRAVIVSYAADGEAFDWLGKERRSLHMPRTASRLTLIVTAPKIERLADISAEDCAAEGATPERPFGEIFKALHGADIFERNPEVVALTFTVHQTNIDQLAQVAA